MYCPKIRVATLRRLMYSLTCIFVDLSQWST